MIVSHTPKLAIVDLKKVFDFDEMIFDASNKPKQINIWEKDCDSTGIRYWNVVDKGAFTTNL